MNEGAYRKITLNIFYIEYTELYISYFKIELVNGEDCSYRSYVTSR